MKILIVASGNHNSSSPFITEQVNNLIARGISIEYYLIKGKGLFGYLRNLKNLNRKIKIYQPNLIHAHYGFSGLLANFQRKIPVVVTYHGSDVNQNLYRPIIYLSVLLSKTNIYVSERLADIVKVKKKSLVIPCGTDLQIFKPTDKTKARGNMGLDLHKKYILFSSHFKNTVKNAQLAFQVMNILKNRAELIELKNYSRDQVANLFNAVDIAIMTSFTEGSPQFIKEAMACNCPIVSTNVGDVKLVMGNTDGCYLASYDPWDFANKTNMALDFAEKKGRTDGRKRILELGLESETVIKKIIDVYCRSIQ
jgi:glycosyltransferase involved in cell wall biosynthesis